MTSASPKEKKLERRKSGNGFREISQRGYHALVDFLKEECVDDLAAQLTDFTRVEDLMSRVPTLVPVLLELAWNAR
jgi:hypothetical protein